MIIFPSGIVLTANENASLLHGVTDAETWLSSAITEKARLSRDGLIEQWRPTLYADNSVTKLPANYDDLATLILARSDYKTRAQKIGVTYPVETTSTVNKDNYDAVKRSGSIVTLFPKGIDIPDLDVKCILAFVGNIEEWIYGAILGQVNRGRKKMVAMYHPVIMADSSVTTMPATQEGLISMIIARADYSNEKSIGFVLN